MTHFDDVETQKSNLAYIRSSMKVPILKKEEELDLARAWQMRGDKRALDSLVTAYARLVIAMASKFKHYGLPLGDLIQEGNIGLMTAANRFDPERDIRFSTYAAWWIRSAIQDYVLRNWSIVRTGTTSAHKSLFFNFRRLRARIANLSRKSNGSDYLDDDQRKSIARDLNVNVRDVEAMEGRLHGGDLSLNGLVAKDSDEEWQNMLADERPTPEDVVIGMKSAQARSQWLQQALAKLNERERTIIRKRHLNQEAVTLEDLGKTLGISKERVRQLEQRAMDKLKSSLSGQISRPQDLWAA